MRGTAGAGWNHHVADGDGRGLRARAAAVLDKVVHAASPGYLVRTSIQVILSVVTAQGDAVMRYTEQQHFDLLILGRRGNAGQRKTTLGRVAQRARADFLGTGPAGERQHKARSRSSATDDCVDASCRAARASPGHRARPRGNPPLAYLTGGGPNGRITRPNVDSMMSPAA